MGRVVAALYAAFRSTLGLGLPQEIAHPSSRMSSELVYRVGVSLGSRHFSPAHDRHDSPDVDALEQEKGCSGVTGVVKPNVSDPSPGYEAIPFSIVSGGIDQTTK